MRDFENRPSGTVEEQFGGAYTTSQLAELRQYPRPSMINRVLQVLRELMGLIHLLMRRELRRELHLHVTDFQRCFVRRSLIISFSFLLIGLLISIIVIGYRTSRWFFDWLRYTYAPEMITVLRPVFDAHPIAWTALGAMGWMIIIGTYAYAVNSWRKSAINAEAVQHLNLPGTIAVIGVLLATNFILVLFLVAELKPRIGSVFANWMVTTISLTALCLGAAAFYIKRRSKLWYGVSEVVLAAGTTWFLVSKSLRTSADEAQLLSLREVSPSEWIAIAAAVYVFSRGIANVVEGIEERKAAAAKLKYLAPKGCMSSEK